MVRPLLIVFYLTLILAGPRLEAAEQPNRQVETSVTLGAGHQLSRTHALTSFTLEPLIRYEAIPSGTVEFYGSLERPTANYQAARLPKLRLTYEHAVLNRTTDQLLLRGSISALEVLRWDTDGYQWRPSLGAEWNIILASGLALQTRLGVYTQYNQFSQTTAGTDLPDYGISQTMGLIYQTGRTTLEARVTLEQRHTAVWKNDYATLAQVGYRLNENVGVAVAHEMLSHVVDESTGLYQPVRLLDGRDSRISASATLYF